MTKSYIYETFWFLTENFYAIVFFFTLSFYTKKQISRLNIKLFNFLI